MADAAESSRELLERARAGDRAAERAALARADELLPAVLRSLADPDWKVRRDCLRFLDHHLDARSVPAVLARLEDEHPDVRKWAAHALGCDHCKEAVCELGVDVVGPLIGVVRNDPSLRVRRSAVLTLAFHATPDERIPTLLRELLDSETDEKIRFHADYGLKLRAAPAASS